MTRMLDIVDEHLISSPGTTTGSAVAGPSFLQSAGGIVCCKDDNRSCSYITLGISRSEPYAIRRDTVRQQHATSVTTRLAR